MERRAEDMGRQIAQLLRQGRGPSNAASAQSQERQLVPSGAGGQVNADDIISQQLVTFSSVEVAPPPLPRPPAPLNSRIRCLKLLNTMTVRMQLHASSCLHLKFH